MIQTDKQILQRVGGRQHIKLSIQSGNTAKCCKWQTLFILQSLSPALSLVSLSLSFDCADLALFALLQLRCPCDALSACWGQQWIVRKTCSKSQPGEIVGERERGRECVRGKRWGAALCVLYMRVSALSQKYHTQKKNPKTSRPKKTCPSCPAPFHLLHSPPTMYYVRRSQPHVSGKVKWNNVQSRDNNGAAPGRQPLQYL